MKSGVNSSGAACFMWTPKGIPARLDSERDAAEVDGGLQRLYRSTAQDKLDDTAHVWNAHNIRPSKNPNVSSGQPNVMYSLPEL